MFNRNKTTIINATAVIRLTPATIEFLRKIQLNHSIPENAKYIAFLEDGDATFLEDLDDLAPFALPKMHMISYHENIPVEFDE